MAWPTFRVIRCTYRYGVHIRHVVFPLDWHLKWDPLDQVWSSGSTPTLVEKTRSLNICFVLIGPSYNTIWRVDQVLCEHGVRIRTYYYPVVVPSYICKMPNSWHHVHYTRSQFHRLKNHTIQHTPCLWPFQDKLAVKLRRSKYFHSFLLNLFKKWGLLTNPWLWKKKFKFEELTNTCLPIAKFHLNFKFLAPALVSYMECVYFAHEK